MSNLKQSREDLFDHLQDQMHFLQASCSSYDEGSINESKRLAVVIRVLVHDTSKSKSLLNQLDMKSLQYLDTSLPIIPGNLVSHQGLTMIRLGSEGSTFVPRCLAPPRPDIGPPRPLPFDDWWNAIVLIDQQRIEFTRKDLVLTLSNKEGGAHVDPRLDSDYVALTRHHSMGWRYSSLDRDEPIEPIELASVRQIAYEIIISLESSFPELFENPHFPFLFARKRVSSSLSNCSKSK